MREGRWNARYYDGRTAAARDAVVSLSRDGLEFRREDGSLAIWPFAELRAVSHRFPARPNSIERGGEVVEALVIDDPDFWRTLRVVGGPASRHLRSSARRGRRSVVVGTAAIAAAAIAALYIWGIPAMANHVATTVPVEWEERLGAGVIANALESAPLCQDRDVLDAVQGIVDRLAAVAGSRYTFRVHIVRRDVINAFAAPGGQIVVYQGLLAVTTRAEELAGILAHEMDHVIDQHGTRAALRQIPLQLIVGATTGQMSGAAHVLGTLGVLRYGRHDEAEADQEGLALMRRAGIDPSGMVDAFRTLERQTPDLPGVATYLSTHPRTEDRIEDLSAALVNESRTQFTPLLPNIDWERIASTCVPNDDESM